MIPSAHNWFSFALLVVSLAVSQAPVMADELLAGAAKVDITNRNGVLHVNDPLYVKVLVVKSAETTVVLITVDAVAIAEIGTIPNDYLSKVRAELKTKFRIQPEHVMINASHCHGVVCADVGKRTVAAVKQAVGKLVPVKIGVGVGHEDRIMENRRLKLKNGKTVDVRHAYSLPPSEEIADVGPVDPKIGILRLDRVSDGTTLAVVYNFACHPIQGVPNGGNTADITGFASRVIEENLDKDTIALFVQGCGGDINPVRYKDVNQPRDAEPLGNMLGLSTLKTVRKIQTKTDARLKIINESLELPRANTERRIALLEAEQQRLLKSLTGTSLDLETFVPLYVKYKVSGEYPSYYSHRYMHEKKLGRNDLARMDAVNMKNMKQYLKNIHTMEKLTRINTNLRLLRKHQLRNQAAKKRTLTVELVAMRIGDFVLTTFPGELTVEYGLHIKKKSPHKHTFVAGYTNGYIFYAPTAEQLRNVGGAQEDSDCLLAPEWEALYKTSVLQLLNKL